MSEAANDNMPPMFAPPWVQQSYVTYYEDAELRLLDIATQAFGDGRLANSQRWRVVDYIVDRFGRPATPTTGIAETTAEIEK